MFEWYGFHEYLEMTGLHKHKYGEAWPDSILMLLLGSTKAMIPVSAIQGNMHACYSNAYDICAHVRTSAMDCLVKRTQCYASILHCVRTTQPTK